LAERAVRPGDVIAQCLIAAKGEFVSISTIHDFLIARNMVNATRKIGAYIGDIKKYNFGLIERSGDRVRLVNWQSFDTNGHNRNPPPGLTVRLRDQSGIYTITNARNGAMYVGQAMNFGRRWAGHENALNKGTEHYSQPLQDDWNAFGKEAFAFKILLVCDLDSLKLFEDRAISVLKPTYNTIGTRDAQMHTAAEFWGLAHTPGMLNGATNLGAIAGMLRTVQVEQHVMQDEIALIRRGMADLVTPGECSELLRLMTDRIAGFETLIETRFDQLFVALGVARSDQPERVGV
jgi:hypothetical protein